MTRTRVLQDAAAHLIAPDSAPARYGFRAFVIGRLVLTSCNQAFGAPLLDRAWTRDRDGRRYRSIAVLVTQWWRRKADRDCPRAAVFGWREEATAHLTRLVLLLLAVGLLCGQAVLAQEPAPAPTPAPCDPQVTPCWSIEKQILGFRIWNQGQEPENLVGARGQGEVRYKGWRVAARIDGTATAAEVPSDKTFDLSTVRDVEAHVAASYDLLRLPQNITVGPMCAAGLAFALPRDGQTPSMPRSSTLVCGLAGSWPRGRIHLGGGAVHSFDRGLALASTWQIPTSDHTANIGWFSYGRRTVPALTAADGSVVPAHGQASSVIWTGMALSF